MNLGVMELLMTADIRIKPRPLILETLEGSPLRKFRRIVM
jgi:hypothetical protein